MTVITVNEFREFFLPAGVRWCQEPVYFNDGKMYVAPEIGNDEVVVYELGDGASEMVKKWIK